MGSAIAERLLAQGHRLTMWNRTAGLSHQDKQLAKSVDFLLLALAWLDQLASADNGETSTFPHMPCRTMFCGARGIHLTSCSDHRD